MNQDCTQLQAMIDARDHVIHEQARMIHELELALKPFGRALQGHYSDQPDTFDIWSGHSEFHMRFRTELRDWRAAAFTLRPRLEKGK